MSYHDPTTGNSGHVYRTDDVDLQLISGTNYTIGWTANTEWQEYTVNVEKEGSYDFEFTYAAANTGAQIGIDIDGSNMFSNFDLVQTAGWTTFETHIKHDVQLPAGESILRINTEQSGFNLDKITISESNSLSIGSVENEVYRLQVFPNPSPTGLFNLSQNQKWEVYAINGVKISEGEGKQINLSEFAQGLYLLKTEKHSFKLLKK
ncbi:carbohydrate-binding protein [Formosa sp. PL04]|uniref:carbohydrate-binding protein n=1 Tax=Formosa sp. PL04 TaxID=3081755 RepID=UPI0029818DA4|nr:carbohydrate-binding protein [Formosa sp. PL04]MDW5288138.1 carbohydrate-binding protein [Formosa sp. PL04]